MGSYVMHLAIAKNVLNKFNKIENTNRFYLGNIAPDATKVNTRSNTVPHILSHYLDDYLLFNRTLKLPNYHAFIHENEAMLQDDFILGYISHLVSDHVWYKDFNSSLVKFKQGDSEIVITRHGEMLYELYRNTIKQDYDMINKYLVNHYQLDLDIQMEELPELEYIDKEALNFLLKEITIYKDIEEYDVNSLAILSEDLIDRYIEKATDRVIMTIENYR